MSRGVGFNQGEILQLCQKVVQTGEGRSASVSETQPAARPAAQQLVCAARGKTCSANDTHNTYSFNLTSIINTIESFSLFQ